MLAPKKVSGKKITIYSLILIIVLAGVGILIYKNFIAQGKKGKAVLTPSPQEQILPSRLEVNFPGEVLKNPLLNNLKMHGQLPVEAGEQGRTNPFQKF